MWPVVDVDVVDTVNVDAVLVMVVEIVTMEAPVEVLVALVVVVDVADVVTVFDAVTVVERVVVDVELVPVMVVEVLVVKVPVMVKEVLVEVLVALAVVVVDVESVVVVAVALLEVVLEAVKVKVDQVIVAVELVTVLVALVSVVLVSVVLVSVVLVVVVVVCRQQTHLRSLEQLATLMAVTGGVLKNKLCACPSWCQQPTGRPDSDCTRALAVLPATRFCTTLAHSSGVCTARSQTVSVATVPDSTKPGWHEGSVTVRPVSPQQRQSRSPEQEPMLRSSMLKKRAGATPWSCSRWNQQPKGLSASDWFCTTRPARAPNSGCAAAAAMHSAALR